MKETFQLLCSLEKEFSKLPTLDSFKAMAMEKLFQ